MAVRPWVFPADVREYSQNKSVQDRTDVRLEIDISRAEMYVCSYCRHQFTDEERYPVIPPEVRTAVILLAEYYAQQAEWESTGRSLLKSETNDDYSYTAQDAQTVFAGVLDSIKPLLDPHIAPEIRNGVRMDAHKW